MRILIFLFLSLLTSSICQAVVLSYKEETIACKRSSAKTKKKRKNDNFLIRMAAKNSPIRKLRLNKLIYVRHIYSRGSGGVYIFRDRKGNKYTVKFNKKIPGDRYAFIRNLTRIFQTLPREIVADSIYKSIGLSVPDFVVYSSLPEPLRRIRALRKKKGIVRIAQFIPSRRISLTKKRKILKRVLRDKFAIMLTFMYTDLTTENLILGKGSDEPWFIDNDSFLRATFLLLYKNHFPNIKQDIQRLKSGAPKIWYQRLGTKEIKRQIRLFLKKEKRIMRVFNKVSKKIKMPNRFSYLIHLKARFKALRRFVQSS